MFKFPTGTNKVVVLVIIFIVQDNCFAQKEITYTNVI